MTSKKPTDTINSNRRSLWLFPLVGCLGGLTIYGLRVDSVDSLRMATEASIGTVVGFAWGAFSWLRAEANAGKQRRRNRVDHKLQVELNSSEINIVRSELQALRKGLKDYLNSKKVESEQIRSSIIDLNNDVSRLKENDPAEALRPQLKAIAAKFSELASVRSSVSKISRKMRRVEGLAQQVAEVEARMAERSSAESVARRGWANWFSKVKDEVNGMWSEVSTQVHSSVRSQLEEEIARQVAHRIEASNQSAGELLEKMAKQQEFQFSAFERQIQHMSDTIEGLNQQVLELERERDDLMLKETPKGLSAKLARVIQLVPHKRKVG